MKIKTTLLLLLIAACLPLQAQTPAPTIQKHLKAIAKDQNSYLPKDKKEAYYNDAAVIKTLEPYLSDENEKVQKEAVGLTAKIGAAHTSADSRQRAVYQLLTAALTASSIVTERIAKGLRKFKPSDFGEESIAQLSAVIAADRPHRDMFIRLAGYLQLKEELLVMKSTYAADKKLRTPIGMALVRSDDAAKRDTLLAHLTARAESSAFKSASKPLGRFSKIYPHRRYGLRPP